jgi:hypothetical protein
MPSRTSAERHARDDGRRHHENQPDHPRQPDAATADPQTRHAGCMHHERSPPVTSAPATARQGRAHCRTTTRSAEHIGQHPRNARLSTIRGRGHAGRHAGQPGRPCSSSVRLPA